MQIRCTRFVTYGSALASKKTWQHRATWRTILRKLDLTGNSPKRLGVSDSIVFNAYGGLVRLTPRANETYEAFGTISTPFDSFTLDVELLDGAAEETVLAEAEEAALA
jgi:hypothetical protein